MTRLAAILFALVTAVAVSGQGRSKWVWMGEDHRLHYGTDARGNRIMDFSHAGYQGGGVRLPDVREARRLAPAPGDGTARIQAAIDEVSRLPLDATGFRGAVVLEKGAFDVGGALKIAASGVVLRGSGSGENGTIIRVGGAPHRFIDISGEGSWQPAGTPAAVADAFVPAGATSFTVDSAAGFKAGDSILIQRPVTEAWIRFMGMDTLARDGKPQTWIKAGTLINHDRVIKSISGNRITLDVPLSDSFDAAWLNPPGTTVVKYVFPGRIEHVGLEGLRVTVPAQDKPTSESQYTLLRMNAVSDAWVRDVVSVDTHNSTTFGHTVRRVTVDNVHIRHTMPFTAPAAPADFAVSGTQILVDRSSVTGQGVWPYVTQQGVTGPNVVLNFKADGAGIAPHQRWATGLLVDSSELSGGTDRRPNVAFSNREYAGSGHGWSVGWAVAWNVRTDVHLIQQPPGSKNWCIGCTGRPATILWHGNPIAVPQIPSETFEAPGTTVSPASLYLAQLRDRLGERALEHIGRGAPRLAQPTIEIEDYVTMPITGRVDGKASNEVLLARVNTLREEAGGAKRFFISDMNGPLYIFDKATKQFTVYLDFNGNQGKTGLFDKLTIIQGYGNGLNGFYLDPDHTRNGKFYTVHIEDPALPGSSLPDNAKFPGLNANYYTPTPAIRTPGPLQNEGVLVEWTDTNPSNSTFEGTARELLRAQLNTRSHPMGDLIFNPTARRGDPDWRVLYMECGDGASGESKITAIRSNPQRLDNFEGKIIRIIPDLNEHKSTSTLSENGRYRIPNDNPFVSTPGARPEIWAYGFRNPHRLNWGIDPANPANNRLIVNSVGMRTWETVYLVHRGGNYGYARREGTELFQPDNLTGPRPEDDRIPIQIGDEPTSEMVVPKYPVIQYGHGPSGGDAIGSGFVYNGKAIPALRGKYIFTDLTTGRIWFAEYKDMLAADDGKPDTLAAIREVRVRWNNPNDSPDAGKQVYDSAFPIALTSYHARGGTSPLLPGPQDVATSGRADVRFSIDASGELYLYSKSDGVIRKVVAATGFK